jgi:hypothetical protein
MIAPPPLSSSFSSSSPTLPADWAPLVERLRLAHVDRGSIDVDDIDVGRPRAGAADSIVIDAHNGLVDVDARLSLAVISRVLAARGWMLPLLRPLPTTPLWRLATRAPFVVDTVCQQGLLLSGDGDLIETPAAPRHSAGPSLLHGTTTLLPLAVLVRARLRVMSTTHTTLWREEHPSTTAVGERLRALVDDARAFGADAHGTTLWILGGTALAPAASAQATTAQVANAQVATAQVANAQAATATTAARRPAWASATSLRPGDVGSFAAALDAGHRVAVVPYLQRAAALHRARPARALVDVPTAAAALAAALTGAGALGPQRAGSSATSPVPTPSPAQVSR